MNKNIFKEVQTSKIPKSVHDLSHEHILSCNMGELIPVTCVDCLPGDRINLDNESLVRFAPMIAPVFGKFNVTYHRFFVPKRLLWDQWDEYVSMTKVGTPAALPVHPYLDIQTSDMVSSNANARLYNYMGIPWSYNVDQTEDIRVNPLRFAAYQFIYNEFYRDQNLIPEVDYKCVSGDNAAKNAVFRLLRKRAWAHDYFTSGLPQPQKGDPVLLPLRVKDVDVRFSDQGAWPAGQNAGQIDDVNTIPSGLSITPTLAADTPDNPAVGSMFAKTSELEIETNMNDLRRASAIQRFQEKLMRGGSRFTEFLKMIFNVSSRDSRLQRPEYIGGDLKPVTISEVVQMSQTVDSGQSPQGNMAGHGAAYLSGSGSSYFCEEHGYVIVIMNIQPKAGYFQGLDKEFLKINHPTDIYLPDLANLGEQPILRSELYAFTADGQQEFAYVPRWTEHRFMPSRVSGDMATSAMYHWHPARFFDQQPDFNQVFIEMSGEGSTDRIFAVEDPSEQKLWVDVYNTVKMVRPIPKFGTPSLF